MTFGKQRGCPRDTRGEPLRLAKLLGFPAYPLPETFTVTSYEELCELASEDRLQMNARSAIDAAKALTRELDARTKAEMRNVAIAVTAHVLAAVILQATKQIITRKVTLS